MSIKWRRHDETATHSAAVCVQVSVDAACALGIEPKTKHVIAAAMLHIAAPLSVLG